MKKLKDKWPVYLVNLISFLILAYFVLGFISFYTSKPVSMLINGGTFTTCDMQEDPDSMYRKSLEDLPYRLYKEKADSMDRIKDYYSRVFGGSSGLGAIGVEDIVECDTCSSLKSINFAGSLGEEKYYFYLSGFKLVRREDDDIYPRLHYKKGGISYLKYVQFDSVRGPDHKIMYSGHWVNKVIPYRVDEEPANTEGIKRILIPISQTSYTVLNITCWILVGIVLLLFCSVLRSFMLVLTDIARGNAFTVRNYKRLFYITNVIVLIPATFLIIQLVLQWVFRKQYAGDLVVHIGWGSYLGWVLVAMVMFLLAMAFHKGYRIQQEQDLTI